MPGGGSAWPSRPIRLWTMSSDRLVLSTTFRNWIAFPLGLGFSAIGILLLNVTFWTLLAVIGLVHFPPNSEAVAAQPVWQKLIYSFLVTVLAAAFFTAGALVLLSLSVVFDRARRMVTVRSGWMGVCRQNLMFREIRRVFVRPSHHYLAWSDDKSRNPSFDIDLERADGRCVTVAIVSQSSHLAQEVVNEICDFTGLVSETRQCVDLDGISGRMLLAARRIGR